MDDKEFCGCADRYKDMVYRVALNFLGAGSDAEDAVQEAFLKLYTSGNGFESEEHRRRWLIRVTLNICKNMERSRKNRRQVPLEALELPAEFETEEQTELYSAVMSLPEKYRTVLYLFYYEEYSVREIGQILDIRESNVTTRLSRGRELLKTQLMEARKDEF